MLLINVIFIALQCPYHEYNKLPNGPVVCKDQAKSKIIQNYHLVMNTNA